MTLRDYYNVEIINYFQRKNIKYKKHSSKLSDYYYILNIKGKDNHTLKIRISNHDPFKNYEIPFLQYKYYKKHNFPSKHSICCRLGEYIAFYKEK